VINSGVGPYNLEMDFIDEHKWHIDEMYSAGAAMGWVVSRICQSPFWTVHNTKYFHLAFAAQCAHPFCAHAWAMWRCASRLFIGRVQARQASLVLLLKNYPYPVISRTYLLSNKTIGRPLYSHQIS
jgi:hypothetical protein